MLDFELFIYIFCNKKSTGFLLLSLALNWLQHYLNLEQKSVNAAVELYLSRCATISEHGIISQLQLILSLLPHFISRGGIKSPWSRRKRKRALSCQHWNRLFSSNGKLRDGGRKFLKKVRSGVSIVVIQDFFLCIQPLTDLCWKLSYAHSACNCMLCSLFHFDGKLNLLLMFLGN